MGKAFLLGAALFSAAVMAELQPIEQDTGALQPEAEVVSEVVGLVSSGRSQAVLLLHTEEELRTVLLRADALAANASYQNADPVVLVLYGDEIALFARDQYRDNKALVDLAARLDAFNVVDLKVCEQWLGRSGLTTADLPSFLQPVADGNAEIQGMQLQGFASF
ncbi:DsrE family protein [Thalassolituus marinus]|uniref:DsrE family protein n=1 Tax=Thalassolituus marinus TaxID=671053 RepID=A0ABS7ZSI3_9GAMM|nr:DsrE family protein [Thalassolituus marinus]MCA6063480.1 DsrE family protein [Thalassolituus marinus]